MRQNFAPMLALSFVLCLGFTVACGDSGGGTRTGDNIVCNSGEDCDTTCSTEEASCNMDCQSGSTCSATCQAGKSCNFMCAAGAMCDFVCTEQSCQASGGDDQCMCSGECLGTCGGASSGNNDPNNSSTGNNDPNNSSTGNNNTGDCVEACGDPLDPGYADCLALCQ